MTLYATFDELQPKVDLAAYYEFDQPNAHRYRVPGTHFLLVEQGRIYARTPTGDAEARAGEMLCFPAADTNEYGYHGPVHYYEAHIQLAPPPRHRHAVWIDGVGPLPLSLALGSQVSSVRRTFSTICMQLGLPGPVPRALVTAAVWEMLAILAGMVRPSGAAMREFDVWQLARTRLASAPAQSLEVQALARELKMSVDHLIRGFRQRFGESPGHFRTRERLRQAAHRLRSCDEPIKTIARVFGFEDAYSFSRAFRKYLGVLPSDLRSGAQAVSEATAADPLLPMNRHIIPPNAGTADFYGKFQPK
jgi:AraC-like DNA-binding protein